jgi:hypothetical protein
MSFHQSKDVVKGHKNEASFWRKITVRDYTHKERKPGWYTLGGYRLFRNYMMKDVFAPGKTPRGHPKLMRGPRGGVKLAVGQVWVELGYDELWQIAKLEPGPYEKLLVSLRPYRCRMVTRTISERTLRYGMMVWEDSLQHSRKAVGKLRTAIRNGEGKSLRGSASYFGIDLFTGIRTD